MTVLPGGSIVLWQTSFLISLFGQDAAGELYVVDVGGGNYGFIPLR